jgi:uncharacterized membrane protein YfhO
VNGSPAEVRPSGFNEEGLWRWVTIPPGISEVRLTYRPPMLFPAMVLTIVGFALACGLMYRPGRRREES